MPVKRNSWPANSNDSHNNTRHQNYHGGDCDSKSHAGSMNVPPENSLMQQLLMDLGYPDVAKMLEEKVRHRLQLLSGSFSEPTNISGNGANGLDTANVDKNDATMGDAKGAETAVEHKCKGDKVYPPSGAIKAEGGECEARKLPPHFNTTTIALFASLMHRGSGDGVDGVKNTSALNELCRLAIYPLRGNLYSTSPTADNNHGSNNNDDDDNGANSLISHLQKLFNVFMDSSSKNNNDTNYYYEKEHGEGRGRKQLHINLSPEWVSILEVFFAYIGVLWEQLCLVEAVSWADFTSQGWLDHRHKILKSLSYLQEKLQRLLLDAHLLEMDSCTCEDSLPSQGGNQPSVAVELSSVEKNKNNSFSSYFSEHEPQLFMKDIQAGVVALFCRGAPTLRKNMEDVFTWIMSHCGRLTSKQNECNNNDNNNKSNNNSGVRKKEPFTYSVNDNDSSSSYSSPSSSSCGDGGGNKKSEEQEEEEEEESVGHKPWQMFMGIVRNAALGEGGKASEMLSSHKYESAPAFNPALQWSQTFFRIQFLSWVIGSIAELSEVLLHHNQTCVEKTNCKSDKRQKKGSEATTRKASIVCVSLGFWYQNCASQITEFLDMNKEKSACKPKSCFFQTKLSEEGRSIGLSLVNTLKSIEHEFLAGTSIMPEPLHLSIVRDDINSATGTNFFKSKGNQGILHPHAVYNKENDIHTAILSILATGQPLLIDSVSEPQDKRNTLHRVLKKVLRTPKKLLDMQDERVAVDDQLRCMENMTLYTLLSHWKGNGTVQKGLPNRSRGNQSQNEKSFNDHVTVRIYEGDISLSGEVVSGIGNPGQNAAENTSTGIGVDLGFSLDALDMPSSFSSPRLSLHYQLQGFMRRLTSGENETQQSEENPSVFFEEDDEGTNSTEQNLNDPMDEVLNEVQIVSVTPCGSLLALLTTKGRLIVFALHAAKNINHKMANKRIQESFCEQIILDTSLMKSTKCPYWYEQLESFLAFSPCGRFLLCSVQNAPPYVEEGDEKNRSHIETTGKVFIYSLHCTKVEYSDASETLQQQQQQQQQQHHNVGGDEERLYAAFQIHKTLITVARWLDPRFWRDKLFSFSSMHPLEKSAPVWKREAQQRLSSLQCLSSGRDNLILRWSPADGAIIQRIATFPVFDILVSPLMQAFYTINQNGELSMYDAWNERDVESATENVVIVSQRGLPAALSMLQLSGELPDGSTQKTANPMKDGEMQEAFFMGTRVIGFDRRSLVNYGVDGGGGGASYGSAMARMSRVMQESGLPSGTETKEGNRLGRRIVQHVVHQGGDYLTPHTPAVIEPSSDSESDNNDDAQSNISWGRRGYHHGRSANRDHMNPGANPISFLRASRSQSERNKIYPSHSDPRKGSYNNPSIVGGTALYKTGARLVFEEVSQELCISASLWPRNPDIKFTYLPSLDSPQLLSMAASGYPTWCDEDEDKMLSTRCRDSFISIGQTRTSPGSLFTCSYYTDAVKRPVKQENVNSYHKNNNNNNGTFALPYTKGSTDGNFIPPKSSYRCSKGRHVLSPTAKNGRYLCIMASVGPRRMAISSASPLKYHAGMYACVVFDVLYGAVVRVIPVCPVLPRTAFTENGVSRSHSNTRRSPIYVLPCDVTVVHHPHTRRSEGFTASSSSSALPQGMSSGREDEGKSVFNGIHYFQRNSGGDGDDDEEEEEDEKEQGGRGVGGGRYGADENVMVLVAVGALHSTTYVFDALTGSRIKVVGLRKQMSASTILTSSQTRPRAKRARCSYVSLGSLGTFNSCHSHEVNGSGNHHNNADAENPHDSTSSASSSELPSRDEVQNDNQRQMLVNLLVEKYGMGTMLRTATELLRVVPLPFPLYNKTFQKDDMSSSRKDPRSTGHSRRQSSCDSDIQTSTGTSFSSPFSQSLPVSALLLKCPSFLGQLQRAASETALADGTSLRPSRADNEVSTTPVDLLHDVPFAHVEHREPSHVQQTSSGDGGVQVSLAESASSPNGESVPNYSRAAAKSRKQFRCGVVNSVALLYDEAKDGVYLFSSDEYGGLFMAGGLMSPHI